MEWVRFFFIILIFRFFIDGIFLDWFLLDKIVILFEIFDSQIVHIFFIFGQLDGFRSGANYVYVVPELSNRGKSVWLY